MKLSVVISAYNEEEKIKECLESVIWADEIIFVDNSSIDRTVAIAKKYTKNIFIKPNNLMLNVNKNYGFLKASNEWLLSLDADERITPELRDEIQALLDGTDETNVGYWIPRKNIIFGKWIQSKMWWPDYQLRLFQKSKGKFPEKHVHEYIIVDGKTGYLQHPMAHSNYTSVQQYLRKMETIYTESEVNHLLSSGYKLQSIDALRFPFKDFIKTFFAQQGYKDGLHGLVLSMLQAFYMEVVFIKVWEKQGFPDIAPKNFLQEIYKEYVKIRAEIDYWFLTSFMEKTGSKVKKLFYRLKRKQHALKLKSLK